MTDVDRVLQVERFNEREVIGVGVHFVAVPWLARPAMPATVVGDTAVSAGGKKHHLVLPGVRAQRPAMAEDHGLFAAAFPSANLRPFVGLSPAHCAGSKSSSSTARIRRERLGAFNPVSGVTKETSAYRVDQNHDPSTSSPLDQNP